ncbi:hypothetical protein DFH06DRAFT_129469 [Mycena polygramma]|nr:hypothetical protein DFH06DRAFT_129469 [Mycena polygramma]
MANVVVRRLINPTEDEIEEAAAILNSAFLSLAPEPFGPSLTGGNPDLDILFNRAGVRAGLVGGEVWVAGFGPTDICAVAVWFGPGTDYLATEEQRAAGWDELRAKFTPELKQWWSDYLVNYNAWNVTCLGEGTKLNSWQLQLLGTSPKHHKKGLAGALIRAIELKADGAKMCLETTNESNVAFYKKLGFEVRGPPLTVVGSGGTTTLTCLSKN